MLWCYRNYCYEYFVFFYCRYIIEMFVSAPHLLLHFKWGVLKTLNAYLLPSGDMHIVLTGC